MNASDSTDQYQRKVDGPGPIANTEDALLSAISKAGDEKTRARLHTQLILLREKKAAPAAVKAPAKVLEVVKAPARALGGSEKTPATVKPQSASEILLKQEQSKPAAAARDFDVVK